MVYLRYCVSLGIQQSDYVCVCVCVCVYTHMYMAFPGGAVVKNPPANAGGKRDASSVPGLGRSSGVGNGSLL